MSITSASTASCRGPAAPTRTSAAKYVTSSRHDIGLAWPNSTLISGDVPAEVAALREQPGGNLVIMGSGQLIRSLLPHGLIDELFLMIHPLVLGSGQRLFGSGVETFPLRLVDCTPTATGVLMATYQPRNLSPATGVSRVGRTSRGI